MMVQSEFEGGQVSKALLIYRPDLLNFPEGFQSLWGCPCTWNRDCIREPAPETHGMQVEAARRGYRWTDAAGHTVVEPVVPPAALTTIVSSCSGADAKFGPLRSRLRLLRCYGALREIAFAGMSCLSCLPTVLVSRALQHAMEPMHSMHHLWWPTAVLLFVILGAARECNLNVQVQSHSIWCWLLSLGHAMQASQVAASPVQRSCCSP